MVTVRKGSMEDADALLTLVRDFATSFPIEPEGCATALSQILSLPNMYLAVALSDSVIIGYVLGTAHLTFYASGNVAWVEEIMVSPTYRRKGVGKLLMESFEEWGKSKEARLIALATRRAADFYQSIGYTESATYFRKVIQ